MDLLYKRGGIFSERPLMTGRSQSDGQPLPPVQTLKGTLCIGIRRRGP